MHMALNNDNCWGGIRVQQSMKKKRFFLSDMEHRTSRKVDKI